MPEVLDDTLDPEEKALLSEADALIRGRRSDTVELSVQKPTEVAPLEAIPVLTDLVAPGRPRTPRQRAAAATDPQRDAFETILARVEARLDLELPTIVERRILRELSASIDYAIGVIGRDLESELRGWIRQAVIEVMRGDAAPSDATAAGVSGDPAAAKDAVPPA